MKYMIISVIALLICIYIGFETAYLLRKKITKRPLQIIIGVGTSLGIIMAVCAIYLFDYYHADNSAIDALNGNDQVKVEKINGGYFFDGPGDNKRALVFYPGAKVEAESYSQLLVKIAEGGEDCFLATMPFNLAILNTDAADIFIEKYNYNNWDIAGHSMGGMVAANYAMSNEKKIDRLIFLAAYPSKAINGDLTVLSIYGDCDEVLNKNHYETVKKDFPSNFKECIIKGGNHSQMGNYGHQKGDGQANVSYEQQWQQIADFIRLEK